MTAHVFVDETKEKGYLVTAAALVAGDLAAARRTVRGLVRHMPADVSGTRASFGSRRIWRRPAPRCWCSNRTIPCWKWTGSCSTGCVRELGCQDDHVYRHHRAHEEPLLALPDAIAWSWHRGGQWRKRVEPLVTAVKVV